MNLKTLSLIVPLVTTGWLGFGGVASAAKFSDSDVLSITTAFFQINAAGIPGVAPDLITGEANGNETSDETPAVLGLADALFGTYDVTNPTPTNRVINLAGTNTDYQPGHLGEFRAEPSSTGGFNAYKNKIGKIRSFDGDVFDRLQEVNGGFNPPPVKDDITDDLPDNFFADNYLISLGTGSDEIRFYLTAVEPFGLASSLVNGFANLKANGYLVAKTDDAEVDFYRVTYELSGQSLRDDGNSPDQVIGDGVTGAVSTSATLKITIDKQQGQGVPEPSTLLGLSAVAGVSALMKKNMLKKDQ